MKPTTSQAIHVSRASFLRCFAHCSILEVLNAVLDYPAWYLLVSGFQTQFGNLSALAGVLTTSQGAYKNGLFGTGSFLENHDQPRFPSLSNDTAVRSAPLRCRTALTYLQRLKNAMAFPFIHDGIPIVYYGMLRS